MDVMKLHIDDVEFNQQRIIGGNLCFQVNDQYFPEENWYDAITVDLNAWLPQLLSFARNHTDSCLLAFQDGPCFVKLNRLPDGSVTAECLWEQKAEIEKTVIDFSEFLGSVVKALRNYQRMLYVQGIPFPFAEQLSQLTQVKKTVNVGADAHIGPI